MIGVDRAFATKATHPLRARTRTIFTDGAFESDIYDIGPNGNTSKIIGEFFRGSPWLSTALSAVVLRLSSIGLRSSQ